MSRIVITISGLLVWFIVVFGVYVVIHGHLTPGGGFQGGAVLASAVALVLVAHGREVTEKLLLKRKEVFSLFESVGLLGFIGLGFAGLGAAFFYNFLAGRGGLFGHPVAAGINPGDLNTAGVIPLMNFTVGLEVLCGLSLVVLFLLWGLEQDLGSGERGRDDGGR
ncbi:MAG: MnhB domain-containing protein [Moorellales bacterium]